MSPLVSPPSRGYPDWQRVDNYDTGVLYSLSNFNSSSTVTSPVLDVSRFAYLSGWLQDVTNDNVVQVKWYADSAASVLIGTRQFITSHTIAALCQLRLPNMGPFVTISVSTISGGALHLFAQLLATNRVHPLEFLPASSTLLDVQNGTGTAGLYTILAPNDYASGPAKIWYQSTQAGSVNLQTLSTGGNWDFFYEATYAANTNFSDIVAIPAGAWRVAFLNSSGVNMTFDAAIVQPTTGSI